VCPHSSLGGLSPVEFTNRQGHAGTDSNLSAPGKRRAGPSFPNVADRLRIERRHMRTRSLAAGLCARDVARWALNSKIALAANVSSIVPARDLRRDGLHWPSSPARQRFNLPSKTKLFSFLIPSPITRMNILSVCTSTISLPISMESYPPQAVIVLLSSVN